MLAGESENCTGTSGSTISPSRLPRHSAHLGDTAAVRALLSRITDPGAVRPLAVITLAALYVNIVSGALVRVTNSGLGCPDWPLCNGRPTPAFQFHTLIEFSNRVLAFLVIVIALWHRPLWAGRCTIAAIGLAWLLALWAYACFARGREVGPVSDWPTNTQSASGSDKRPDLSQPAREWRWYCAALAALLAARL